MGKVDDWLAQELEYGLRNPNETIYMHRLIEVMEAIQTDLAELRQGEVSDMVTMGRPNQVQVGKSAQESPKSNPSEGTSNG